VWALQLGGGVNDDWLVHKSVEVNKHLVKASPYLAGASLLGAGLGLTLNPQYYSNSVGITAGGGGENNNWPVQKSVAGNEYFVKTSAYLAGASLLGAGERGRERGLLLLEKSAQRCSHLCQKREAVVSSRCHTYMMYRALFPLHCTTGKRSHEQARVSL